MKIDTTDATIREARVKLSAIGRGNACIFASQRVNKRFYNTIQGSQQLLQALWMLADKPPACYTTPVSRLGCVNPMFIKASTRTPRTPTWRARPGLFWDFYPNSADENSNDFCMSVQDFLKLKIEGPGSWKNVLLFNSCFPGEQVCDFAVANREDYADFWVSFPCAELTLAGEYVKRAIEAVLSRYPLSFCNI